MAEKTANRRFRFRTRTLFVLIVIASLPCWVCSIWVSRSRYQRDLRIELQKAGAEVSHHNAQLSSNPWATLSELDRVYQESKAPKNWFRQQFGDDFFAPIRNISHSGPGIGDKQLEAIAKLRGVEALYLPGADITDEGVAHVGRMRTLNQLDLSATEITDAGLESIQKLTAMKSLTLSHTVVSDQGLKHLSSLDDLWFLDVENTYVTAGGIADLQRRIPDLRVMWSHAPNAEQHAALVQFARLGGSYATQR